MAKVLEFVAVRLRAASLLLTMLALIAGILALHILAGGHGTGDHGSSSGHSAAALPTAGDASALPQGAASNHQTHHGVDPAGSNALMTANLPEHETGPAAAQGTLPSHTECHESCPEVFVLSCVLALTLLGLAVLPRRTFAFDYRCRAFPWIRCCSCTRASPPAASRLFNSPSAAPERVSSTCHHSEQVNGSDRGACAPRRSGPTVLCWQASSNAWPMP